MQMGAEIQGRAAGLPQEVIEMIGDKCHALRERDGPKSPVTM